MSLPRLQEVLASSVLASSALLERYLAGFDDRNRTRQAPGLPNHAAWCLGHLALTMLRARERFTDHAVLPASDFLPDAARGDSSRYATESVSFGSVPIDDPSCYPSWGRCREIITSAFHQLADTVRATSDEALEKPASFFGGATLPAWQAVPRIIFHNGTHCGQIADLRRALGLGSVFA